MKATKLRDFAGIEIFSVYFIVFFKKKLPFPKNVLPLRSIFEKYIFF